MKLILLLLLFTSLPSGLFAQAGDISVKTGANSVKIINTDVFANCCSKFESVISVNSKKIVINQKDTTSEFCRCMCYFDLEYKIDKLSPGTYFVEIYREEKKNEYYPRDTFYLAAGTQFTIKGKEITENIHETCDFRQSECKNSTNIESIELPDDNSNIEISPNPATSVASIKFNLSGTADVKLSLYNLLGKEVSVISRKGMKAGPQTLMLNAKGLPPGIYIGKLVTSYGKVRSFKLVWSK
ncbi:MAG: T9SS type A sorting domain-containing protein [Bacteroidota bacterium]